MPALAVAMLRHQKALEVPAAALSACMGGPIGRRGFSGCAPGPLVGERDVWLDGGHNPSAARRSRPSPTRWSTHGKPLHLDLRQPRDQGRAGDARAVRAAWPLSLTFVPIPDHACFTTRASSPRSPASSDSRPIRIDSATSAGGDPAGARVLIFGSLYLAGDVLAANEQVPD